MSTSATATDQLWFVNTLVTVRVSHEDGQDGISVLESVAPYGDSPPLHVHTTEDEVFQVLEGELRLVAAGGEVRLGPGEWMLAPKGVPHTYRVESQEGARWIVITTRGDFERFVRATSRPADLPELPEPQGPPTPEQAAAFATTAHEFGIELVGHPLTT
jgi:quercetin dioxygenase-like cupin family protein